MGRRFFHMSGSQFVTAANGLVGTPDYPFASAPYFFFLAAIAGKSTWLAVFLAVAFLAWFPLWAFIQLIQPMRALFAWSLDRVLPEAVASVDERTHLPLYSLGICTVLAAVVTWWAVTASNFAEVLSAAALLGFPAIFLVESAPSSCRFAIRRFSGGLPAGDPSSVCHSSPCWAV